MTTLKITLKNKVNREGRFPVILRITKDRKSKIISLGMFCLKQDWNDKNSQFKKSYPNYIQRNRILLRLKDKALKIIDDFRIEEKDFTLNQFEEKFRNNKSSNRSVFDFFNEIITEQVKSGKIGSAKANKDTQQALFKFCTKQVRFKDITPEFLEKFEAALRERGNEEGGIAFRMRHLRSLYNKAITRGVVSQESYPFKYYKISKLSAKKRKRALSIEEFRSFRDLDLSKHKYLIEAHNFFLFSFYTRGMNFVDMMELRWSDIQNGRIYYTRSKTKGQFNIEINTKIKDLLGYYENQDRGTGYVFPILLKEGLTPKQIFERKNKVRKRFNKKLKELAKMAGIKQKLTSYVARHSFATILKKQGTSTDIISELMGHSDVHITMTYLKEFENEVLDKESRKLLDL